MNSDGGALVYCTPGEQIVSHICSWTIWFKCDGIGWYHARQEIKSCFNWTYVNFYRTQKHNFDRKRGKFHASEWTWLCMYGTWCLWYNDVRVYSYIYTRGRCGRDRMVVGFTTTCAISTYHHERCEIESHSWRSVLNTIEFVSYLRQVGGFIRFPPSIKLIKARYNWNIVELEVALKTIPLYIDIFHTSFNYWTRTRQYRAKRLGWTGI